MMTTDPRTAGLLRHLVPEPRRAPADDQASTAEAVVVGVDGSDRSVTALVWALRHALDEDRPVVVVTAWPLRHRTFVREVPGHFNDARWEASEAQARALARALSLVEDVPPITTRLVNAPTLDAVVALTAPDRLLVLGTDRRDGDDRSAGTTSMTSRAQAAARGPVLLVPEAVDDEDH